MNFISETGHSYPQLHISVAWDYMYHTYEHCSLVSTTHQHYLVLSGLEHVLRTLGYQKNASGMLCGQYEL